MFVLETYKAMLYTLVPVHGLEKVKIVNVFTNFRAFLVENISNLKEEEVMLSVLRKINCRILVRCYQDKVI